MKLVRYPYSNPLFSDFDSLFSDHFRSFSPFFRTSLSSARHPANSGVEWYETDEGFVARVDLPGVKKEDLKVEFEDGLLRLGYERRFGKSEAAQLEKREQVLRLPEGINPEGISANLEDGVLQLDLPKAEEAKPLRIEIK